MRTPDQASMDELIKFSTFNALFSNELMQKIKNSTSKEVLQDQDKPYYRAYLNIIKRTASLIQRLNIEDPLIKCSLFYYLLWGGFFSNNRQYCFEAIERYNNASALGADIMLGKGACLNNCDMLSRILRATGTESYFIGCQVSSIKSKSIYEPTNNLYSKETLGMLDMGNHVVSIFAYQDSYYLSDPTNMTFLSFSNLLEGTYTGEKEKAFLKPKVTLMLDDITPETLKDILLKTYIYSDEDYLEPSLVEKSSIISRTLILQNIDLFLQFYEANQKDIKTVCTTLKKTK